MRNPEQVLNILAEHSNESGYKYERLYRILFNEQMFLVALTMPEFTSHFFVYTY